MPKANFSLLAFSMCLLIGTVAAADWDLVSQNRSAEASATIVAATRCDGGESRRLDAPDFGPFEARVSANGTTCGPVGFAGASAGQRSYLGSSSITATGGSSTSADRFGRATGRSSLRIRFRIDTPRSFALEGAVSARSAGGAGAASAHLLLTHPDGSVDSVLVSATATFSGPLVERTLRAHGGLVLGEYSLEARTWSTGGVIVSIAGFSLQLVARKPVAVKNLSWQSVKALYR